jgi:23S rRNA (adenine2503-C2)-methyltransferase
MSASAARSDTTDTTPKHVREAIERLRALDAGDAPDALPVELMNFTRDELGEVVAGGLDEASYRADQVWQWIYAKLEGDFAQMTSLSKALRGRLEAAAAATVLEPTGQHPSDDGTTKLTFRCRDGAVIETVFIPAQGRNTLCISSQVGCAMGCTFCYTAKMGLKRQLSCAEIVEQVWWARRLMGDVNGHIGNIVFMGMGEPLHNYDNVKRAISILTDRKGLDFSWKRVTVSTSGLVPQIQKLRADTDVRLAISLNASTDAMRSQIMPINERYDLEELMDCLRELPLRRGERITFEYVLIRDLNDSLEDAQRIIDLTAGIPRKVNVIPFNPHPKTPFETPSEERIDAFSDYLADRQVTCLRRKTRGRDAMAACGQLGDPGDGKEPRHVRKKLAKFREQRGA